MKLFIFQFLFLWGKTPLWPLPLLKMEEINYITYNRLYSLGPTRRILTLNFPPSPLPNTPPQKDDMTYLQFGISKTLTHYAYEARDVMDNHIS